MKKFKKEVAPITYTAAGVRVLHFDRPAGFMCFRIHWHERMEMIRLHRGTLIVTYGVDTFEMKEGDVAIFPPQIPHGGIAGAEGAKYDVLMFDVRSFYHGSEVAQKYLTAVFTGRARFDKVTSNEKIVGCVDAICFNEEEKTLRITAIVYELLYWLYECNLIELRESTRQDSVVQEIVRYIEQNSKTELNTAMLSEHFGYTEAYFCRKFKEATGLTPMRYLMIFRLEEAYRMLKDGERNIGKIAVECGFADANYFTRCFKAHFGVPPSKIMSSR